VKRPVGVTILAILAIIGGVLSLLLALFGALGTGLAASGALATSGATAPATGVLAFATASLAILGILYLAFGIGALMLKGWAWTLGVIALVLGIISNLVSPLINGNGYTGSAITNIIISIVVEGLLLYYLFRPNVRAAFGKAA
jgi:hypothetical protein